MFPCFERFPAQGKFPAAATDVLFLWEHALQNIDSQSYQRPSKRPIEAVMIARRARFHKRSLPL